jgi:type III secretory pathway component EscT
MEKLKEYVSLVIDRQKRLASAFHEHMTKDQSYHTSNSNRETFYNEVIKLAERVSFLSLPVFVRMTVFSSLWKMANKLATTMNLTMACMF